MKSDEILEWVIKKLDKYEFQIKLHALTRINERGFLPGDIRQALVTGKVIEDYPDDRRGHSCLVWGRTSVGKDLHVVCGIAQDNLWIITVYEPTADQWETPERRKTP